MDRFLYPEQRIAQMEKDTERLDYLDDPMDSDSIGKGYSDTLGQTTRDGTYGYVHADKWYATFREAVDAAIGRRS
jgi:hypothetical protein